MAAPRNLRSLRSAVEMEPRPGTERGGDPGASEGYHNRDQARHPEDYRVERERQCDFCLEPYVDDCTKCGQDFCDLHAGDIDGLCGGCI